MNQQQALAAPSVKSPRGPTASRNVLLVGLLFLVRCHAMIGQNEHVSLSSDTRFSILWSFEFASGGSLNFTIDMPSFPSSNVSLELLVCTDTEIDHFRNTDISTICAAAFPISRNSFLPCEWAQQFGPASNDGVHSLQMSIASTEHNWYRLLQLNCFEESFEVYLSYIAMNPNGEYLSLSQVPFKALELYAAVGWGILTLLWCINWWRYRFFNVKLQRVITVVPLVKMTVALANLYYWRAESSTGRQPTSLYWVCFFLLGVAR